MSRILVVEDDDVLALTLRDDLELEGYTVEVVGDGATASARARTGQFDLILLDVMLPGRDGFEVCRDVRRAGLRMPIILLTARAQEADKVLGLEIGADDYVTKPFSARELRARVKAALRRGVTTPVADIERFGDIELDLTRGEIRRAGAVLDVTPTEFRLLATLAKRRGQVLSRQRILDEGWGPGTFITDRVIDTHVANLRKKIEPEPSNPVFIVSVRGQGYRFDG
jgi:DNA-binding response OmpR family regulator